jgi:hypothetical protein
MLPNINTVALSDKCLPTVITGGLSALGNTPKAKQETYGSPCKTTSLFNGDLEIEVIGADGYEISNTSFHDKGWE